MVNTLAKRLLWKSAEGRNEQGKGVEQVQRIQKRKPILLTCYRMSLPFSVRSLAPHCHVHQSGSTHSMEELLPSAYFRFPFVPFSFFSQLNYAHPTFSGKYHF